LAVGGWRLLVSNGAYDGLPSPSPSWPRMTTQHRKKAFTIDLQLMRLSNRVVKKLTFDYRHARHAGGCE
jgi:hypothetical protein